MEFSRTPTIKVYCRGTSLSGSGSRSRILAQLNDDEETENRGRENQMARRMEGDLNWASKYLHSDRSSSLPRGQSSTEDLRAPSVATGRYNGLHLDESTVFGSRSRRSISPMGKYRDEINGSYLRSNRASASPLSVRKDYSSRTNGHLVPKSGRPPTGFISPIISHPVTRTYDDLSRRLPNPSTSVPLNSADQRTKKPISGTRRKLRSVLCRSHNDPHYFDED